PATTGPAATTGPEAPVDDLVGPGRRYQGTATVPVASRAGTGTGADLGAGGRAPLPPPVGPDDNGGRRRSRWPLVVRAGLAAAALAAAGVGGALADRDTERDAGQSQQSQQTEQPTPPADASSAPPQLPADEQCTDEIRSNPRWVCLI